MMAATKDLRAENERLRARVEELEEEVGNHTASEIEEQLEKCKVAIGDQWLENTWLWESIESAAGDAKTLRAFCEHQGATPMMVVSQRDALQRQLAEANGVIDELHDKVGWWMGTHHEVSDKLAEARRDTERLDWFEENAGRLELTDDVVGDSVIVQATLQCDRGEVFGHSAREVIDAARVTETEAERGEGS